MPVKALLKTNGLVSGVVCSDSESGREYRLQARVVINATGVFVDSVRQMDEPGIPALIAPSQGVHLVLPKSFLPGDSAIMVPHTEDGRVLFAVPWNQRIILGTTDTPVGHCSIEPLPLPHEIEFLLTHAARFLSKDPGPGDVCSLFAGLRPLVGPRGDVRTAMLSRDHHVLVSQSGLVTVAGGKWTTYRKMGEDAVNKAAWVAGLEPVASATALLRLHGACTPDRRCSTYPAYGSDGRHLEDLATADPSLDRPLHPNLPYRWAEVVWAVRQEMARRVEDVLARRTRALVLDAAASIAVAPEVARVMAAELGKDAHWQAKQVEAFEQLAGHYRLQAG
jgi:glycerol-3-phosphate dehydrogenase